jgi:hypothetical protein
MMPDWLLDAAVEIYGWPELTEWGYRISSQNA